MTKEKEKEFVIFINEEKLDKYNRYWICIGNKNSNNRIVRIAKISYPYTDFTNAALKALELSSKTGWPYVGAMDTKFETD